MAVSFAAIASAAFFVSTTVIVCFCAYCESARIMFLKCFRYFLQRNCCCYQAPKTKFSSSMADNSLRRLDYKAIHSSYIYGKNVPSRHNPYFNYRLDQFGAFYPTRWWSPETVKGPRGFRCNCFWNYRINSYWPGLHKTKPIVTYPPSPSIPMEIHQNDAFTEPLYGNYDESEQNRGSEVYYVISIV